MCLSVTPAAVDDLDAACRMLSAHRSIPDRQDNAARIHDALDSGAFDRAGLFVARDEAAIRGVVLVQPLSGALGLAWPPRTVQGRDRVAVEDGLVAAASAWLRSRGVKICQAFTPAAERGDLAPLARHGFQRVSHVVHMQRETSSTDFDHTTGRAVLQLVPFASDREMFMAALLSTYAGSLDCPELTGDRTPQELVDGFLGNGFLGGAWWFAVEYDGAPAGVVMWEPGTTPGVLDLEYLGLAPRARGRGVADQLVSQSLSFARDRGLTALNLSVDGRNEPALKLYRRRGFQEYDRRDVYLAAWPAANCVSSAVSL